MRIPTEPQCFSVWNHDRTTYSRLCLMTGTTPRFTFSIVCAFLIYQAAGTCMCHIRESTHIVAVVSDQFNDLARFTVDFPFYFHGVSLTLCFTSSKTSFTLSQIEPQHHRQVPQNGPPITHEKCALGLRGASTRMPVSSYSPPNTIHCSLQKTQPPTANGQEKRSWKNKLKEKLSQTVVSHNLARNPLKFLTLSVHWLSQIMRVCVRE